MADERWVPGCPRCRNSLILAPGNQHTHSSPMLIEVYCQHCDWHGKLVDYIKMIYIRV